MDFILDFIDQASRYPGEASDHTWAWFQNLNREEWLVVLAIGAAFGFILMMLGFGNRR